MHANQILSSLSTSNLFCTFPYSDLSLHLYAIQKCVRFHIALNLLASSIVFIALWHIFRHWLRQIFFKCAICASLTQKHDTFIYYFVRAKIHKHYPRKIIAFNSHKSGTLAGASHRKFTCQNPVWKNSKFRTSHLATESFNLVTVLKCIEIHPSQLVSHLGIDNYAPGNL